MIIMISLSELQHKTADYATIRIAVVGFEPNFDIGSGRKIKPQSLSNESNYD